MYVVAVYNYVKNDLAFIGIHQTAHAAEKFVACNMPHATLINDFEDEGVENDLVVDKSDLEKITTAIYTIPADDYNNVTCELNKYRHMNGDRNAYAVIYKTDGNLVKAENEILELIAYVV